MTTGIRQLSARIRLDCELFARVEVGAAYMPATVRGLYGGVDSVDAEAKMAEEGRRVVLTAGE